MEAKLHLHNLTKSYASFPTLKNVDLELEPGKIMGILGPNGSGKALGVQTKALVTFLPVVIHLPNWMTIQGIIQYSNIFYEDFDPESAFALLERLGIDQRRKVTALSKGTREKLKLSLALARKAH